MLECATNRRDATVRRAEDVCLFRDEAQNPAGGLEGNVRSASANRAQAWSVVQIRSELAFSRGQRQGSPELVLGARWSKDATPA